MRICGEAMDFDVDFNNGDEGNILRYYQAPVAERRAKGTLSFQSVNIRSERKAPKEAGQASMRVRRRVMDLRAILDNGDEGNTLAVLSSPRCSKACKRITIFSILKYTIGEKGAQKPDRRREDMWRSDGF